MKGETQSKLIADLKVALKALPAKLRPKDGDIGAIAVLLSDHPALQGWCVVRKPMNFGDMGN